MIHSPVSVYEQITLRPFLPQGVQIFGNVVLPDSISVDITPLRHSEECQAILKEFETETFDVEWACLEITDSFAMQYGKDVLENPDKLVEFTTPTYTGLLNIADKMLEGTDNMNTALNQRELVEFVGCGGIAQTICLAPDLSKIPNQKTPKERARQVAWKNEWVGLRFTKE